MIANKECYERGCACYDSRVDDGGIEVVAKYETTMKPIAWYDPTNGMVSTDKDSPLFTPLGQVLPLYTQRTWVGLTKDEILDARWHNKSSYKFARVLEAKLKERNT
jgi:hypothetical protein